MRSIFITALIQLTLLLAGTATANAGQTTITGPAGSVTFGARFAVLPNGNVVVVDPTGVVSGVGAVYLYTPAGVLISQLTGSSASDNVGEEGITVLSNGNFVVASSQWNNGATTHAGAVTWVNGTSGLNGVVSASNSLVGSSQNDLVGQSVTALSNGNYVVASPTWSNGATTEVGAVTWSNGLGGTVGAVSASNSLIGSTAYDVVGSNGVKALSNGNYVVVSSAWSNGASTAAGAATWADGTTGVSGTVSVGNSLVGTTKNDAVGYGGVVALNNGNYVVAAPFWNNGVANSAVGATIWANGASGKTGLVSAANALYGTTAGDQVGNSVVPLSNGNYVVVSSTWNGGTANAHLGAVTWANGATAAPLGAVSASNSLVGSSANDAVGATGVTPLPNGNYVVSSSYCSVNGVSAAGAVTWGSGTIGIHGPVSMSNSLYGTSHGDGVGSFGAMALSNGNYVVNTPQWTQGTTNGNYGAVTWGNGTTGVTGAVTAINSMIGSSAGDEVGFGDLIALTNGNYVIGSSNWQMAGVTVGAVTLRSGAGYSAGGVTSSNSLVGTVQNDLSPTFLTALSNGNFVAEAKYWSNGTPGNNYGAVSFRNGSDTANPAGVLTPQNSLVGSFTGQQLGAVGATYSTVLTSGVTSYPGGVYAISTSPQGSHPGSVTLADGRFGAVGTQQAFNTVYGNPDTSATKPIWDATYQHLVVGFPSANQVVLLSFDEIFVGRFE